MQNRMPIISSRWPSIPRKLTDERSGSLRFASPLACSAWANAAGATRTERIAKAENFNIRDQQDARLRGQLRMANSSIYELRMINGFRTILRGIRGFEIACPSAAFRTRFHRM